MSNSSDEDGPPIKKYKNKSKVFQNAWLDNPLYKNWLTPIKGNIEKCRCSVCNTTLACGKSELDKHAKGQKHIKKMASARSTPSISTFVKAPDPHSDQVKSLEIAISAFFAEHNIAFQNVDHLIDVLKNKIPDSKIIKDVTLHRTKCTEMVKNVLCRVETEEIIQLLKNQKFSILLDESTDISEKKLLCLLVRYINKEFTICTTLLELIELDAKDCSAAVLFTAVKNCFDTKGIPFQNIVGVASDGAAVMVGKNNSFFSRVKEGIPHALLMQCICHSSAIVASKACAELPRSPEDLIRNIGNYISGSAKRCAILCEFQVFFHMEKHKILKLSATRWLSMHQCVSRILENWDVLQNYFVVAVAEDHLKIATTILEDMRNPLVKGYLLFLTYVLNYFNSFNALFQSRAILIDQLYERCCTILRQLSQNFLKPQYVYQCLTINVKHPEHLLAIENVRLGTACTEHLKQIPADLVYEFRIKCLNFYITATQELQLRMPVHNSVLSEFKFLRPDIALDIQRREAETLNTLGLLGKQYNSLIDVNKLDFEWQSLPFHYSENKKRELSDMTIEQFWKEVSETKDFNDTLVFSSLSNVAKIIMSLPHSNAEAERIFSMVTDIKNKKRNRLSNDTLNAVTVFRSALQAKNQNCTSFKVSNVHLDLHNKSLYSFKNDPT